MREQEALLRGPPGWVMAVSKVRYQGSGLNHATLPPSGRQDGYLTERRGDTLRGQSYFSASLGTPSRCRIIHPGVIMRADTTNRQTGESAPDLSTRANWVIPEHLLLCSSFL